MDNVDKSRRLRQTNVCESCGEAYSVTYRRCPFCGGKALRKTNEIDIKGPDVYDLPEVPVRPSAPNPSPTPTAVSLLDDFDLDLMDFTPELDDETSSVPKPPPGASGGKRLAGKGTRAPQTPAKAGKGSRGGKTKSGGGGARRGFLLVLSLLIIAAAVYIVATKAMPLIDTFLENRAQANQTDDTQNPDNSDTPDTPDVSNVPNFTLTETRVTMTAPGAVKQLVPKYEPAEEIGPLTWSSDNPEVVTVSEEGRLTAVSVGSASVTVTRADGSKAVCSVTCTWDEESILENLGLNYTDFTLRSSDPPVQMKVVGIEGTPPKIVWESHNPAVAAVAEAGLVTWVGSGKTEITATINNRLILSCDVHCR